MSTNWDHLLDDSDEEFDDSNLVKQLRKALKTATKELNEIRTTTRKQTIEQVIAERGLNPKIAALVPQDADVKQWLEDFGDVFGSAPKAEDEAPQSEPQAPAGLSPEEVANMQAIQGLAPAGAEPNSVTDAISKAQSAEEVMAIIQNLKG